MDLVTLMFFCFSILSLFRSAIAKWVEGSVDTDADWKFLGRFCFLSQKGSIKYTITYPIYVTSLDILFYYDDVWPSVYKSSKTCYERLSVLDVKLQQLLSLDDADKFSSWFSGCKIMSRPYGSVMKLYWNCTGDRIFHSTRERWWFIVVSRCNQTVQKGLQLDYSMHLTNGDPHDILYYEFSADEFYILPTDLSFFLLHLIILGFSYAFAVGLYNRQLLHTTFRMFLVSVCLWTFHLFLLSIAYGRYSKTGRSERKMKVTARIFSSASDIIFLLMILLMASGFTITRGRLMLNEKIALTLFVINYTVVYIILLMWEATMFDEGLVLYIYQSGAGYCLIAMRIVAWFMFLYLISKTFKRFRAKQKFYVPFFTFYSVWFWLTPVMILISNLVLPQWIREKTVNAIELFIGASGHIFFLVLTSPVAANKNFPYHIRTSQIACMEAAESCMAYRRATEFRTETGPDFTSLFLVSYTHTEKPTAQSASDSPTRYIPPCASTCGEHDGGDSFFASTNNTQNPLPPVLEPADRRAHTQHLTVHEYNQMFQVSGRSTS